MTTEHTPGPWTIDSRATTAIQAGDKHIAMVNFSFLGRPERDVYGEEHDANARLIAAAPDMLAALENLVAKYNAMQDGNISAQLTNGDFFAARAVIAKAKGEYV